nr:ribulose-phosphate 3-epimerase [Maliibacterium massiliense]
MELLPSIASADPLALGASIRALGDWPAVHIDLEDGVFVPNITFGARTFCAVCRACAGKALDVHLMARHPERYLDMLSEARVTSVSAHIEALDYPLAFLHGARARGMRALLALNFKTSASALEPFLDELDGVLVMTAEPDGRGEALYAPALDKALHMARTLPARVGLYADGALDDAALHRLAQAGARGAVLGRRVFGADNPLAQLQQLSQTTCRCR